MSDNPVPSVEVPDFMQRHWNSTKLFVTLLSQAIAGWMGHVHAFEGMYLCIALTAPAVIFLAGQSGIDAVKAFAIAKYAK